MAQAPIRSMPDTIPLATIRTQDDLIEALRTAKEWRNLSFKVIDELGGFTQGHMERILGPRREKGMSPIVFQTLSAILAVKFVMLPDEAQAERMAARWEGRDTSNVRLEKGRVSKHILERARPNLLQEFGEKLALAFGDDVDQLVAGITAKRSDQAPAPSVESSVAILALPPPPAESPQPAKVEALKPRRAEPVSRCHLHVVQPRHKGARWGGAL